MRAHECWSGMVPGDVREEDCCGICGREADSLNHLSPEDCDAGVFLSAYRASHGCDPTTDTVLHAGDAPCRSLPHYPAPAGWKDRMYAILRGAAPAPATVREGGAS